MRRAVAIHGRLTMAMSQFDDDEADAIFEDAFFF